MIKDKIMLNMLLYNKYKEEKIIPIWIGRKLVFGQAYNPFQGAFLDYGMNAAQRNEWNRTEIRKELNNIKYKIAN